MNGVSEMKRFSIVLEIYNGKSVSICTVNLSAKDKREAKDLTVEVFKKGAIKKMRSINEY